MVVDRILDRKDSLHYDSKAFYNDCVEYGGVAAKIVRAMDGGIEEDVKNALREYLQDNEYNPLLVDYIERVNWIRGTEPDIERAAAKEFDEANEARYKAAEKMKASLADKIADALEVQQGGGPSSERESSIDREDR